MPIKPNPQHRPTNQPSSDSHALYKALESAENRRKDLVEDLATRLADLGDPELLLTDALVQSKKIIKNRKTTVIDQTIAILDDYDPITAIFSGDSYGFLALADGEYSGSASDPKLLNGTTPRLDN